MKLRSTHTIAILEISDSAYQEIANAFRAAGYDHAFTQEDGREICDMTNVGILSMQQPEELVQVDVYRHNKTGDHYRRLYEAVDATNKTPDDLRSCNYVVYQSCKDGQHYIREASEFEQKFTLLPSAEEAVCAPVVSEILSRIQRPGTVGGEPTLNVTRIALDGWMLTSVDIECRTCTNHVILHIPRITKDATPLLGWSIDQEGVYCTKCTERYNGASESVSSA